MAINKYNNLSAPRPDRILWKHLKLVIKDDKYLENIVNIANIYVYDSFKSFYSIVLLNTLSKLIEKVINEHLQFYLITNNLIYLNQLEGLKQYSTTDVDIFLTYLIQSGWVKSL